MIEVSDKTLELALTKAANLLNTSTDRLEYTILKKESGFLGVFGKKITLEAKIKDRPSRKKPQTTYSPSFSNQKPDEQSIKDCINFCKTICQFILCEDVAVSADFSEDRLILNIDSQEIATQFTRNSKIAESLEHLIRKKMRQPEQEHSLRIFVDAKFIRQKRENELVNMAQDLSNKVYENKRPIVLNYKSPYDRKIIHMALDQDNRVYTKSIGVGPNRRLMILPNKDNDQSV